MITAASRLQKELRECQSLVGQGDHSEGRVVLHPDPDGDLFLWSATLYGSADSPYADGRFELSIQVPSNYPFHPPIIHFVTRVCHPNVHIKTGEICLDLLQNAWSPAWTLQSTCTAILTLLTQTCSDRGTFEATTP
ncbi:hypothetical protein BASA50_007862 [Batrachochytrium salamandrivorans]|uniref:UBC core domain-containing protein n=1 Tax=Batrachochytrium salamandrivorans TaxID=1357716 RepID=A0ABQ8F5X5_9FUNG|nr:hypothetical protein BASA62_004038 [Batrachochytrium salamandrivorans]KAH6578767.1 hypothetical protein BASA60_003540 [Batrachochytrium salamandrivorans]KAH6582222.1 hypothetical protein BASA61_008626 [Batrachochytrium salamandrivorans]KAH6592811.1 hypothetical protein BASA50_007862 [Batrachochytrium salamandrivorans]KAH9272655.1 protein peroxin-4 [Batrachochytrium salamandrivorans]